MSPVGDTNVPGPAPDASAVNKFHTHDDTDANPFSHHHTLGTNSNQAMPGDVIQGMALPAAGTAYSQSDMQAILAILKKLQGTL